MSRDHRVNVVAVADVFVQRSMPQGPTDGQDNPVVAGSRRCAGAFCASCSSLVDPCQAALCVKSLLHLAESSLGGATVDKVRHRS
jgi:hypothetical protein